jgi:starch synthase
MARNQASSSRRSRQKQLSIVTVVSEALPFGKTGGLADVASALPLALCRLGHRVTVILPRYGRIPVCKESDRFALSLGSREYDIRIFELMLAQESGTVKALLVDCPELYDRSDLYGTGGQDYPDNAIRFAVLARAALEVMRRSGQRPAVVHCHDWQAGLVPVYLKSVFRADKVLSGLPTVFTIHNLAYQGLFPVDTLPALGLGWDLFAVNALEFWGKVSFLKGGIGFSEIVTTVSPTYAREIQTPQFGFGFDGILRQRSDALVGILNGIDQDRWDPKRDPALPQPYDASDVSGKRSAKRQLLGTMKMAVTRETLERPLVGLVSRLVAQKGFDILAEAADNLLELDASYVLLGSGEALYEEQWQELASRHPDRVGVRIGFDEALAHLIEAGADIFLMPSRFEPCGLNQMYSQRYGTVPVVRATGGLRDTVEPYDPETGTGSGFQFEEPTGAAMLEALRQAIDVYRSGTRWRALQVAGMQKDFSWERSANEYVGVYLRAMSAARGADRKTV